VGKNFFIREMNEPMMAIRAKLFTTNYANRAVHVLRPINSLNSFIELFFVKKIPFSRRVEYVMDEWMSQSVGE